MNRNWKADIEEARWNRMAEDYKRQEENWKRKQAATKMGKNSVSYNPITLEYHHNSSGQKLAEEDAKTLVINFFFMTKY
jgi:hypothetical protein